MDEGRVLALWGAVVATSTLAAGVGYALLDDASGSWIAGIQAFAGGAILTMLADEMPEAFEYAKRNKSVGLAVAFGFAVAASCRSISDRAVGRGHARLDDRPRLGVALRMSGDGEQERLAFEREEPEGGRGDHRRRPRDVAEQGDLADVRAGTQARDVFPSRVTSATPSTIT